MVDSWKQSGLAAVAVIAAILIGVALQAWSLSINPHFAAPPFSTVDLATLRHDGIQVDPPRLGDSPAVTKEAILARREFPGLPVGAVTLIRLTLLNALDGAVRQRLVWGMEIIGANYPFDTGPFPAPDQPQPERQKIRTLYWLQFYDANSGSFIMGTVVGKAEPSP